MSLIVPVVSQTNLYVNGLNVAWASNTTLTVAAGAARDSTNTVDIVIGSTITINAAVNGVNGLDTGSLAASTWYYVYAISASNGTQVPAVIVSASSTVPSMPSQYDAYRFIGVAKTNSSSQFLLFYQYAAGVHRLYNWDAGISVLSAGTATTLTAVTLTSAVAPIQNNVNVTLDASFTPNTAGDYVGICPGSSTNSSTITKLSGVVAAKAQLAQVQCIANLISTDQKINYINSAASGSTSVSVRGFTYSL